MNFNDIQERYARIDGFPDYYITESGRVLSVRLRGYEKQHRLRELKPKDPGRKDKYLNIILCNENGQFTRAIHRLVAEYFVGGYFEGAVVNHIDGNNRNNHYTNLEWVSQRTNIIKSYETSGIDQYRNYAIWGLFDPKDSLIGTFVGHHSMESYIKENGIPASPTSLTKYHTSNGYYVRRSNPDKCVGNCNDYPDREYGLGEIPNPEAPVPHHLG